MSRRRKPKRRIFCLVEGATDGFFVSIDPDLSVQDLKDAIYNAYFSTEGSASATDTTRLWKLREPEPIIPESTLWERIRSRGGHISGYAIRLETAASVAHYFPGRQNKSLDVVVEFHRTRGPPPLLSIPSSPQQPQLSDIADARHTLTNDFHQLLRDGIELPMWKPTTPCSKTIRDHIESLRIPISSSGTPSLLFHNLGSSIVHGSELQARASKLFSGTEEIRYLCNTSGSGKTRILLEGLHKNWGFYFTARSWPDGVGSQDLGNIVDQLSENLQVLTDSLEERAMEQISSNASAASRAFLGVLFTRALIFHAFLLSAQQQPGGITESTKRAWLLLQLSPRVFFGTDKFFDQTTTHMRSRSSEDLRVLLVSELDSVRKILGVTPLFIAIDEAQALAHLYSEYFRSKTNPRAPRPVIRNLVEVWSQHVGNMIISGTGLSMKSLEDALQSVIAKDRRGGTAPVTDLGAFESDVNQRAYFKRYLPPRFLTTQSGERLASRIVFWLHGRHRFTAAYISLLLQNCFESPHRVLDAFIHFMSKFRPSDAHDITEKDCPGLDTALGNKLLSFDFSKLQQDKRLMRRIASCVFEYIFTGRPRSIGGPEAETLVEIGFARFRQTVDGVVDEPIVLLAAADFFSTQTSWTMQDYLETGLLSSQAAERGFALERFGAFLLARAFELKTEPKTQSQTPETPRSKSSTPLLSASQTRLSSVFTFIGNHTKLYRESAHLVSIGRDDENEYRYTPVKFSPPSGSNYILGQSPSSSEETLEWLKNPNDTAFCFPDVNVGPDLILLLQLSDATILRVLVQFKHNSTRTIGPVKTEDAFRTTDPSQFLTVRETSLEPELLKPETSKRVATRKPSKRRRVVKRRIANISLNEKLRTALHDMAPLSNKAGESSVLRVLVSYPAKPNIDTLRRLLSEDKSRHPGAIVDLEKLASSVAARDIVLSLASRVTQTARQQQLAAGNQTHTKRKAESDTSGSSGPSSSKRRK